jgi:hypothetical protein
VDIQGTSLPVRDDITLYLVCITAGYSTWPWSMGCGLLCCPLHVLTHSLGLLTVKRCALHALHALLQPGEVEYSLRTFPLGGYVAFPDDDPESPYPKGGWAIGDSRG